MSLCFIWLRIFYFNSCSFCLTVSTCSCRSIFPTCSRPPATRCPRWVLVSPAQFLHLFWIQNQARQQSSGQISLSAPLASVWMKFSSTSHKIYLKKKKKHQIQRKWTCNELNCASSLNNLLSIFKNLYRFDLLRVFFLIFLHFTVILRE